MGNLIHNLIHIKNKHFDYYINENGNLHGQYKEYYQNGKLCLIRNYDNGKLHGEERTYYINGKLENICNYVDGKIHGEYKEYHENDKLCNICNYVGGKIHGEYKEYNENGILETHRFYNMDEMVDLSIHGMDINNLTEHDKNMLVVLYG